MTHSQKLSAPDDGKGAGTNIQLAAPTLANLQATATWAHTGRASTYSARPVEDRACRWLIDGHEVAQGVEAWITTPGPGDQRCEASVRFRVEGRQEIPRRQS